jgi:hypothetical protein
MIDPKTIVESDDWMDFGVEESSWIKDLIYNIKCFFKYRLSDKIYRIKWYSQRVLRPYHSSDCDLWGLDHHLAEIILPKLKRFRSLGLHGYPMAFSEYDPNFGMTEEEYNNDPYYVGGEMDAWLSVIDEIIFAFEYVLYSDNFDKSSKAFYTRYGYKDPYRETEDNLSWGFSYVRIDGTHCMCGEQDLVNLDPKDIKYIRKSKTYVDYNLIRTIGDRAQKGFELFGKYYMSLGD